MPNMTEGTLAYDVEGEAGGIPLILVHPLGADRRFWEECRRLFGGGVRAIACDLRGAGSSPAATAPVTLERSVQDIALLKTHLGIERAVMIGCAVGAMVAALYAARHPERTAGLVMANPGIKISEAAGADLAERARKVRCEGMQALLPGAIDNAFAGCTDEANRRRYEQRFLSHDPDGYAWAALGLQGADLTGVLGLIRCPTMLVPGGLDGLFPAAMHAQEIARQVADAELVAFEDGAHFIPYQQPGRFGETVSSFLDRHRLRG
ncbi:alpha/beta hydrolase [Chelativorans sp. Marseille-P2723]|uniref:alpha/beta fold hydrolase n=1 Tax=Chelativorans sp. Marseille-P2723 TaxID=2709133 RepID=UPI00156FBCFD|nr:alpha/beta hydrolase [Chelativorans sp. Marseille-P2723]